MSSSGRSTAMTVALSSFSGMGPISLSPSRSCLMISVPSCPLQPVTMIFIVHLSVCVSEARPAGSVAQLAVGDVFQVLPVGRLAVPRGGLQQLVPADPPVLEGDLLRGADLDALALFDHADKVGGVH